MIILYTITTFLTAFLLFMVQPMVARAWLPVLGGTPAVWNVCMMCFQTLLLLAYLYAHLLSKVYSNFIKLIIHLLVICLSGLFSIISIIDSMPVSTPSEPIFWLFTQLTGSVAPSFFLLASTSPLLQSILANSNSKYAKNPYMLYVASNTGSLLALLLYPLYIEPRWSLEQQMVGWGHLLLLAQLLIAISLSVNIKKIAGLNSHFEDRDIDNSDLPPNNFTKLVWCALATLPSALLLAVTSHITTNVAAIPLFWIIPLALYLITFMIAFSEKIRLSYSYLSNKVPLAFLVLSPFLFLDLRAQPLLSSVLHSLLFFILSLLIHSKLYESRPKNKYITGFYLWLSLGGAIGGALVTLIAPSILNGLYEYPILILFCLLARCDSKFDFSINKIDVKFKLILVFLSLYTFLIWQLSPFNESPFVLLIIFGIPALITFSTKHLALPFFIGAILLFINLSLYQINPDEKVLLSSRNFFGIKQVIENRPNNLIYLRHGTINHGSQSMLAYNRLEPLSYFHRSGPVGDIFSATNNSYGKVGIIGLGIGAMACYAKAGQEFDLYEIDPLVVKLAQDTNYFRYLSDCPGKYNVIIGDGRLELNNAADNSYKLLFLDAFSSDAVPVHLLTIEAITLYLKKLTPDGIIIFNISNQYLDFRSLLSATSKQLGLVMKYRDDLIISQDEFKNGKLASIFAVMSRQESALGDLNSLNSWNKYEGKATNSWSDHHSNLISLMK